MGTKYFIINIKHNLVGGHDYGSIEAAKKAIPNSNIPISDTKIIGFKMDFSNDVYIHPENYFCGNKTEQNRIRRLMN